MPSLPGPLVVLASAALLLPLSQLGAHAYSFEFTSQPKQCQDLSLKITGNDGKPPYRATFIPFGPTPLSVEVRRIVDTQFNDSSTLSFQLRYPTGAQFVTVVRLSFLGVGRGMGMGG